MYIGSCLPCLPILPLILVEVVNYVVFKYDRDQSKSPPMSISSSSSLGAGASSFLGAGASFFSSFLGASTLAAGAGPEAARESTSLTL